jgi:uroporphyrinogen decarboxylase
MNSYKRVVTAISHKQPDRPPLDYLATAEVTDSLCSYLNVSSEEELLNRLGVDFRTVNPQIDKTQPVPPSIEDEYGGKGELETTCYGAVLLKTKNFPQSHCIFGPFYQTENLDHFDWPTVSDVETTEALRSEIARFNEQGYCTLVHCDNPFKIAYFMRPFEEFLIDCLTQPEYALELMKRIADIEFTRASNGVKAGARSVLISGDFAHQRALMISPGTFRKVLKPILAEFVSLLKGLDPKVLVFLHSDGDLSPVLEDLIECGFDAVHPIQPESMDMVAVKRRYGDRLTLFGGVSVQSELPRSKPEKIRALVRQRIQLLGERGGFILAPSNTILSDTPPESIAAMYQEAQFVKTW